MNPLEKVYTQRNVLRKGASGEDRLFQKERVQRFKTWISQGKTVLDVGCRDGSLTTLLCTNALCVGVDLDQEALNRCPHPIQTIHANLNGEWQEAVPQKFDVVVMSEVLEHLYYPEVVLEKVLHVLKDDGVFIGSVPNAFNLKNRFRLLCVKKEHTPLGEPTHINQFSYQEIHALLSEYFEEVALFPIVQKKWTWFAHLFPGLGSFLIAFKASGKKVQKKQQHDKRGHFENAIEAMYRYHHEKKDRLGKTLFPRERGAFLRKAIGSGKNVLDIGCRDGSLTKEFAEGNHVLGLDIDELALSLAEKEVGIQTKKVDLLGEWGVSKSSFDVVVAAEVLEHLYFPEEVIQKTTQILKKGGVFVGTVPNAFSAINRIRLFMGNKKGTPLSDPTHINHFSRKDLETILLRYYKHVEIYPLGRFAKYDRYFPGAFSFILMFKAWDVRD